MRNAAIDAELTVAFFSLEMADHQLVMRLICSEARMNFERIRRGEFKKSHWITLTNAASALSQSSIYIEDTAVLSVLELKAKARRIKSEFGLDMVIVDYLQLLKGLDTKKSRDSREQEIAEISRSLKGMAKELDVPVLALSQLSRAIERREDKTPILSDLRESGSLEQDADLILFLHRPGMYKRKSKDKSGYNPYAEEEVHDSEEDDKLTELIIGKQRNGPTGNVKLTFLKEYTRFEPYEGRYDDSMMPGSS
jgi:replicative DNA helicase